MKKQEQLYTKNEKGRYVPYEETYDDDVLYRRFKGKYYPVSMQVEHDSLTEGIWVVRHSKGRRSLTLGEYLRGQYVLDNVSNLENPVLNLNYAQLGQLDKWMEEVYFDNLHTQGSPIENFKKMVTEILIRIENGNDYIV